MTDKRFSVFVTVLLSVTILFSGAVSCRADDNTCTVNDLYRVVDGICDYNLSLSECDSVQNWLDTTLTDSIGSSGEWYVFTLCQSGDYDFSIYRDALEKYLVENSVRQAVTRQKFALVLYAVGGDENLVSALAADSVGEQGIMSLVYALHLMNNGIDIENHTSDEVTGDILSLQNDDGGWSLSGDVGDVDVTAMVVQSLAPHVSDKDDIAAAVDNALSFLSSRQRESGGYVSYGIENPESACQVLVALSSLDIDCTSDKRFIKNGHTILDSILRYRLDNGSFCHTSGGDTNGIATVQAYYAVTAYLRMTEGKTPLYIVSPHTSDTEAEKSDDTSDTETEKNELSNEAETEKETEPPENPAETEAVSPVEEENTDSEKAVTPKDDNAHTKAIICAVIIGAGFAVGVILFVLGKRHRNNFIVLAVVTVSALFIVCTVDFRSADDYYNGQAIEKENPAGSVSLTIRCDTIAGEADNGIIPADGIILESTEFTIAEGETVFELLCEAARAYTIHVDSSGAGGMVYVSGIANIYEFDFGDLSGWIYRVNGVSPSVGCGEYTLCDNDVVEWLYTRDLGNDIN